MLVIVVVGVELSFEFEVDVEADCASEGVEFVLELLDRSAGRRIDAVYVLAGELACVVVGGALGVLLGGREGSAVLAGGGVGAATGIGGGGGAVLTTTGALARAWAKAAAAPEPGRLRGDVAWWDGGTIE